MRPDIAFRIRNGKKNARVRNRTARWLSAPGPNPRITEGAFQDRRC